MIEIRECSKTFGDICAVKKVSLDIGDREVFGLVGSNGAGKSTLLRMAAGIMQPDTGEILVDGIQVYENEEAKEKIFYISDNSYFPANYTPRDMVRLYRNYYSLFDVQRFSKLMELFHLDEKRKINTFSKGMKKQLLAILGVSAGTKYLFCDETFDGLDPVMRQAVKSLFASEIMNREFTPVIASHNLRELEDICDHIGLLHKGGILLSRDLEDMKFHIHKVQCVLSDKKKEKELEKELEVLKIQRQGSLLLITARGTRLEILERIQSKNPLFCEVIPLTLEEIFICETEVAGYEIKNIFF
ncbi:MAG TPA: ABC transporter ATP-binding protein [Candidatus Blautia faecavium]|uniref:ABC transporter ATP-binding protein n=1 Tax=Candidatus Blautia faecavium TaxID=2838487 RepID=A0A9D2LTX4_9FIRM|nr:ABC transporter ATP-binding protein [Candidatus Blautia faecavium]